METDLLDFIVEYFNKRKLVYPDTSWQALGFATTEMGEVYELLLDRDKNWIRNNPDDKPKFNKENLAEELGDVIMMIMLAGWVEGVNPIQALKDKINRKLEKINAEKAAQEDAEKAEERAAKEYFETYNDSKVDDNYDYFQDDLNFDAARERWHRN